MKLSKSAVRSSKDNVNQPSNKTLTTTQVEGVALNALRSMKGPSDFGDPSKKQLSVQLQHANRVLKGRTINTDEAAAIEALNGLKELKQ